MARHSFIQMSKLSNVKGRISYISDPMRQEHLYATFSTREDMTLWSNLAKECQEEFKRYGTEGKCIEARELIIALPEEYTQFDPARVLREFTEQFKKRYGVECVSALHHNKTKKNYHIHLIFSERRLLPEPDIRIATRSVFYDETGKRVRTKKEIIGEDGEIRKGRTVIKKGEAYESHLFTVKDDAFKNELFVDEAKHFYTDLINSHIHDPERRLKVFNPNSVYLPTKKIGKNNPKAAEIEADNAALQEKIAGVQQEIDRRMDRLPGILKADGYPGVQAFKRLYDEATILVEQYNRDLAAWERQVHGEPQPQQAPPEKESIRKKLRDMEAEAKRRNDARRQQTRPRSHDYDRGR